MNHADVRNHMADYLEGDLALERRALFDAHLDECSECSSEIDAMRATIGLLRGLPDPEVPPQLANDVMRRIRSGEANTSWLDRLRDLGAMLLEPRFLAPASAAMLAAGIVLGTDQLRTDDPTIASPQTGMQIVGNDAIAPHIPGAHAAPGRTPNLVIFGVHDPTGLRFVQQDEGQDVVALSEQIQSWQRAPGPSGAGALGMGQSSTVAVQSDASEGIAASRRRAVWTADQWLDLAERRPAFFAADLSDAGTTTLAEHELWVKNLVRHAQETGRLEQVIDALRQSRSTDAESLARDFEAESRKVGRSRSGDSSDRAD